jgi:hypothetical protein
MRRALVLGAVVAALAAAGCGGDDETAQSTPSPTATPTRTPQATPPTATAPSAPSPPPDSATPEGGATPGPEEQEGGAGDEEAVRVPVDLTVRASGVRPATVNVPGFLALELRVRNRTPNEVTVTVEGAKGPGSLTVAAAETGTLRLEGLRPGRYRVDAGAAGRATLVSGAEAGP